MSRSAALPKGIQEIYWRNPVDRSVSTRYRVRVVRAKEGFKFDKLFDDLDDAINTLTAAKTPEARKRLLDRTDSTSIKKVKDSVLEHAEKTNNKTLSETIQALAADLVLEELTGKNITLGHVVRQYIKKHLDHLTPLYTEAEPYMDLDGNILPPPRENVRKNAKVTVSRLTTLINTELSYIPEKDRPAEQFVGDWAQLQRRLVGKTRKFGDWKLTECNRQLGMEYIDKRLTPFFDERKKKMHTLTHVSVKRELVDLFRIINDLEFSNPGLWNQIGQENPFEGCTRKFKDDKHKAGRAKKTKRWRTLKAEEEALLEQHCRAAKNPELLQIFKLALSTGMRLSESVLLEWDYVKEFTIDLPSDAAKKGERRILITPETREILTSIPRVQGRSRMFKYKVEGFQTMFCRIIENSGLKDFLWHDLRRTHISRLLKKISSPVAIAQATGTVDVANLKKNTIDVLQIKEAFERGVIETEEQMRYAQGHTDAQMTYHYANTLDPDESLKKKDATQ